jgi:hypothetical protein
MEVTAGLLSAVGFVVLLFGGDSMLAFFGAVLAAISITALFFGQRIAKDYPGAATLVPYFLVTLIAIYILV